MPLSVTHHDLVKSYVRLRDAAEKVDDQPSHLLRFYAVECGLKAAVLRRKKVQTTSQLADLKTHDLRRLASDLRLSRAHYRDLAACRRRLRGTNTETVDVARLHEAWRYGAPLDPRDEQRAVAGLDSLGRWCGEELGR